MSDRPRLGQPVSFRNFHTGQPFKALLNFGMERAGPTETDTKRPEIVAVYFRAFGHLHKHHRYRRHNGDAMRLYRP